jgi:hypothetical protein
MDVEAVVRQLTCGDQGLTVGFADMHPLIGGRFGRHAYAISLGKRLDDRIIEEIASGPTSAYFCHYMEINRYLSDLLTRISHELSAFGVSCRPISPTMSEDEIGGGYLTDLCADFSHKMAATKSERRGAGENLHGRRVHRTAVRWESRSGVHTG